MISKRLQEDDIQNAITMADARNQIFYVVGDPNGAKMRTIPADAFIPASKTLTIFYAAYPRGWRYVENDRTLYRPPAVMR